jgi:hypothetical protein
MEPSGLDSLTIIGLNNNPLVEPPLIPWWYTALRVNLVFISHPNPNWNAFLMIAVAGVEKNASSGLIGFEL